MAIRVYVQESGGLYRIECMTPEGILTSASDRPKRSSLREQYWLLSRQGMTVRRYTRPHVEGFALLLILLPAQDCRKHRSPG